MAVRRVLDRIDAQIQALFEERATEDDQVEWDSSIVLVEDECEEGHIHLETVLSLFVTLNVPVEGQDHYYKTMTHVEIPMWATDDEDLAESIERLWTDLTFMRIGATVEHDLMVEERGGPLEG